VRFLCTARFGLAALSLRSVLGLGASACLFCYCFIGLVRADVIEACINQPSARFMGFSATNQPITIIETPGEIPERAISTGQELAPIPHRKDAPIVRYSQQRGGIFYLHDDNGDERYHLLFQRLSPDALPQRISPPGARAAAPLILPRSGAALFTSTPGEGPRWGILESAADGATHVLTQQPGAWQPIATSRDEKTIVLQQVFGLYDRILYLLDRRTGIKTPIFVGRRPLAARGAAFSADGQDIFVVIASAERDGFIVKARHRAGKVAPFLETQWPLYAMSMSEDGGTLAALENRAGQSVLHVVPVDTPQDKVSHDLRGWAYDLGIDAEGQRVGLTLEAPGQAAQAIVLTRQDGFQPERGGSARCSAVSARAITMSRAQLVAGLDTLPALLLEPEETADGPRPLIIAFHGGPEGQWRWSSHAEITALSARLGAAVLMPNVVGSLGYGLRYSAADDGVRRQAVLDDVALLLNWAQAQPGIDERRIAVMGASYGGYLALLAQTQFNAELQGALSHVGITDLPRFLMETPSTRRALRRGEYGDEREPALAAMLAQLSPSAHIQGITKPVFLSHGANDARVPLNQSTQFAAALRAMSKTATLYEIPDEGHVLRSKENRIALARKQAQFLAEIFAVRAPQDAEAQSRRYEPKARPLTQFR